MAVIATVPYRPESTLNLYEQDNAVQFTVFTKSPGHLQPSSGESQELSLSTATKNVLAFDLTSQRIVADLLSLLHSTRMLIGAMEPVELEPPEEPPDDPPDEPPDDPPDEPPVEPAVGVVPVGCWEPGVPNVLAFAFSQSWDFF